MICGTISVIRYLVNYMNRKWRLQWGSPENTLYFNSCLVYLSLSFWLIFFILSSCHPLCLCLYLLSVCLFLRLSRGSCCLSSRIPVWAVLLQLSPAHLTHTLTHKHTQTHTTLWQAYGFKSAALAGASGNSFSFSPLSGYLSLFDSWFLTLCFSVFLNPTKSNLLV